MALKIIWNDILKEKADAIVTPASRNPQIGTGLDRIVHEAAGPKLLAARKTMGRIGPGKVGVSPAYGVGKTTGAKWIIHALGPVWEKNGGGIKDELILDGCYLRILCKAVELGCKTVSIPVLSSGKFGMPMGRAIDVAVKAISDFVAAFSKLEVKLVGVDSDFYEHARKHYPKMTIARYSAAEERKYRKETGLERADDPTSLEDAFVMGEEHDYYDEQLMKRLTADGSFCGMFKQLWNYTQRREKAAKNAKRRAKKPVGINEFLTTRSQLSVETGISERTLKHFSSDSSKIWRTSKDKILALSVAMKLPLNYAECFLATCGYTLDRSKRDVVIKEFLSSRSGDVYALNERLLGLRLPYLSVSED